ncbi:MAG: permease-like cell division protein FtsX [Myxococcales bacterium]|nr:permease-like cell division protein FtsX [Myxococcales bacterium]
MDLKAAVTRARRGLREERGLYLVAVSSLAVAFLCLAGVLLATQNLSTMAARWGQSGRVSVYLAGDASPDDVTKLEGLLRGLPDVARVEHVTSAQARADFLEHADVGAALGQLPPEAFPASLEVTLAPSATAQRVDAIAGRVKSFAAVTDVETYRGWFDQLDTLVSAGRVAAIVLAALVALCVLAVIGNTIRLAVARRRQEIEVMKLCGATDGFVRGPLVLEGTFQGFVAAVIAILVLMVGFLALKDPINATVAALIGVRVAFLSSWMVVAVIVGGAVIGAAGSALSVRRYLDV